MSEIASTLKVEELEVEEQSDQAADYQRAKGDFEQIAAQHSPSVPQDRKQEKKHPANRVLDNPS